MAYTKEQNQTFALKLLLMMALDVAAGRIPEKMLRKVIKFLESQK